MQNLIDINFVGFKVVSFELKDFEKLEPHSKHEVVNYNFNIDFIPNIEKQTITVDLNLIGTEKKDNSPAKLNFKSLSQFKVPTNYFEIDITKLDDVIISYLFSKSYSMAIGYLTSKMEGLSWTQDDLPKINEVSISNHFKKNLSKKIFPLGEKIISLLDNSQNEEAITLLKKEIAEKESVHAYLLLGTIYSDVVKEQDKAIDSFKKALALDPSETSIYANIGNCYFNKGDYLEAISYYSEAISYNPTNTTFRHLRGICFYHTENFQRAIDDLSICMELGLQTQKILEVLAYSFSAQRNFQKALNCYIKIIGDDSTKTNEVHFSSYLNIAVAYYNLKQFEKSKVYYEKAIKINPKHLSLWNNLGSLYFETQEYEKAINAYKKEIDHHPSNYNAWGGLSMVYTKLGEPQNIINALLEYINIKPDTSKVWHNLGTAYFQLGEYDKALESYNKGIYLTSTYQEQEEIWDSITSVYYSKNEYNKVIEVLEFMLKVNPKREKNWIQLSILFQVKKQYKKAIKYRLIALEINDKNFDSWSSLGVMHHQNSEIEKALDAFNKALDLNTESANVLNYLGHLYSVKKEFKKASSFYNKAIALHDTEPNVLAEVYNGLGFSSLALGNLKKAKSALLKAIELGVKDYGYCNLGHVLFLEGHEKKALDAYVESYKACNLKEENTFWKMFEGDFEVIKSQGITEDSFDKMKQKIKKAEK